MLSLAASGQTLRVANNNPGAILGTNNYATLQAAINASDPGDIVYITPSMNNYGNITIDRSITLLGVGIRPNKDVGKRSELGQVNLDASIVRIAGVIINGNEVRLGWNSSGSTLTDITIENSRVERILMSPGSTVQISNLLIRNNVITGNGSLATHILLKTTSNAIITNNVMPEGNIGSQPMIEAAGAIFSYNLFSDLTNEILTGATVNCTFDHNIFYGVRSDFGGAAGNSGNTFNYNLSFGNTAPGNDFNTTDNGNSGTGNVVNQDPLFVNYPQVQNWNDSYDFSLQAGSPALAGSAQNPTSTDIGPSGGATPFNFEGNSLPLIQVLNIPALIPQGSDLDVEIKAKGN